MSFQKYFSVSSPFKIKGSVYRNGICYTLLSSIEKEVLALEKAGEAIIYEEEMRFITGKARPIKKGYGGADKTALTSLPSVGDDAPPAPSLLPGRRLAEAEGEQNPKPKRVRKPKKPKKDIEVQF